MVHFLNIPTHEIIINDQKNNHARSVRASTTLCFTLRIYILRLYQSFL